MHPVSPVRPATVVEELFRELGPSVGDPSRPMSQRHLRSALTDLRQALRASPHEQLGALFNLIGQVCGRLNDPWGALDAHRNAARYEPLVATHLNNAAGVLVDLHRYQEALSTLRDARARPQTQPASTVSAWLNAAEAHHGLGDASAAREAFEVALANVDPASHTDLFKAATSAAAIGADEDAVELFARYAALVQGTERGDTPAVEIIRAAPNEMKAHIAGLPLAGAIERVTARWDAPIPDEHQLASEIHLAPDAAVQLADLVEHPPAPSETLRRLGHAARG
jgi:tetratricopeptide (TPR) repeat protein